MKKISKYIIFSLCLMQFACNEDFLSTTDPTRIGKDLFYQNQTQFEQALNGVYGQLQNITNSAYIQQEMMSDNTTFDFNPLDRGGAAGWEAFEYSTVNPGNGEISALWNNHYATLYNINYALEKLATSTIDATAKSALEGEFKFLRAYHYFNLTRYFGDVILAVKTLANPNEAFDLIKSPQAKIYEQIISDLNDATKLLPAKQILRGRATQGSALTLLGKVYLTQKNYPLATSTLKQTLSLGYSLNANYKDNFDPARKNGPESIFEVQYQGGNDLGEHSTFVYVFAPRLSQGAVTGYANTTPAGRNIPTREIIDLYEAGDLRKDISLQSGYTLNGVFVGIPFVNKFRYPHTITGRSDNNWPVLRYSDVLLMLAESINEGSGPNTESFDYLNQVRRRAGLADLTGLSKDAFRTAVLNERRIELAFENHRWFDLQRTNTPTQLAALMNIHGAKEKANPTVQRGGIAFNTLDYVYSDFEVYLPIPAPQILINKKLIQNTGY